MPVLAGVHISAAAAGVIFETSDLETSIRHIEDSLVEETGETVAPGKLFADIIKSLPEAAVSLELDGEQLLISCQETRFKVSTMTPIDFPQFPQAISSRSIELPVSTLKTMVKQVIRAVSRDTGRAVLTGILFRVDQQGIRLVATDSYRLAISRADLQAKAAKPAAVAAGDQAATDSFARADSPVATIAANQPGDAGNVADFEMVIAGVLLEEVCRAASSEKWLTVGEAENQTIFKFGSTTFISRKIEGNFPNYEQIIPTQKNVSVVVQTEQLLSAVRRVAVVAKNNSPIRFSLQGDSQVVEVKAQTQDVGEAQESVPAQIDGEGFEIGFNHQYIIDGLAGVDDEEVVFEAQTPVKPGILKSLASHDYFYLTMPVRLER